MRVRRSPHRESISMFWSQLTSGSYTLPPKTPSWNYISLKNTWPKLHLIECTFSWTCTCQKLHFPERAFARNYFFQNMLLPEITFPWTCTCQQLQFPEHALVTNYIGLKVYLAEITLARIYIFQKTYIPNLTHVRIYIRPKIHFPKNLFSRNYTHLPEISIT